jgi:hypothetical protein
MALTVPFARLANTRAGQLTPRMAHFHYEIIES